MSRGERLGLGVGIILVVLLLWLFARGQQRFGNEGSLKLGDIFFGGYSPGSFILTPRERPEYDYTFEFLYPPSMSSTNGPVESPCDCGCQDLTVDFLDLTEWAADYNAALYSQVTGEIQQFFSYNPWAYTFANANVIDQFAYAEPDRRGPRI